MPSLNVYLNQQTHELALRWKDKVSLSDICSRAIRDELSALEDGRNISRLVANWSDPSPEELALAERYNLKHVIVTGDNSGSRASVGVAAARYLDAAVVEGCDIGICGGRQIWEVVRNLHPRRVSVTVYALGIELSKSRIEHVYSNTLATILALLYQPRSTAELISEMDDDAIGLEADNGNPKIIVGSCSTFSNQSDFSKLIPVEMRNRLLQYDEANEFCYRFVAENSKEIVIKTTRRSRRPELSWLKRISENHINDVIMVAGGGEKESAVLCALKLRLCNVLVTNGILAERLLK